MLHILFLILKIIGIILLSLLGILLVVLCIVLLVPARYRVEVKNASVHARASWFFHLLAAYYVYDGNESDWQVRLAWKKLNASDDDPNAGSDDDSGDSLGDGSNEGSDYDSDNDSDGEAEETQKEESVGESASQKTKKRSSKKVKERKKKQSWFEKFKCTIQKICDKIKKMWNTKEKISDFLTDEIHVSAFKRIKNEVVVLARRIRPKKIKGFLRFGMEEPYDTGRILAVLSVLYPFYGENIQICPEFEEKVFEAEISVRGHIHVVTLVVALCNIFFDKNIRKTYNDYKRIKA